MAVEGSLGSQLQGVSQQPARIRVNGQVTEQVNYMSDVSTGLTSRPASEQVTEFVTASPTAKFFNFTLDAVDYVLMYENDTMKVWDLSGIEYTVNYEDAAAQEYVGTTMQFHVINEGGQDVLYCNNSQVIVETDTTIAGYPFSAVLITALGGQFSRTYKITLTIDGTDNVVTYTTPNGTGPDHSDFTKSEYIIQYLADELWALAIPDLTMYIQDDVLMAKADAAWDMSVTVSDGASGEVLRAMSRTVDAITDLPKYAPHGTVVRVTGDKSNYDDYFLTFASDVTTVVGDGFGHSGTWQESADPTIPNELDLTTMPHKLTIAGGVFTLNRGEWSGRQVGGLDSNPLPSFVGLNINDVSGFESRLVVVAGPNVVLSRAKHQQDFFRKSTLVVLDGDPIDMKSTKDGSVTLNWIVQFDRDLILLSDPGDSQFVITGGGLTPDNASLTLTTSFEMFGQAKPVTTGKTIVFPFLSGVYSGIKEFFTNAVVATNGADTLTEVQDKYITGQVDNLVSSQNFNTIACTTDDPNRANTIWVYKYLWSGQERRQSSWSYWELQDDVMYMFFKNSVLNVVIRDINTSRIYLVAINLNKVADTEGWHVTIDRKKTQTVTSGKVTREYAVGAVVQSTGCLNPGRETIPLNVLPVGDAFEYVLDPAICPEGALVYTGQKITRKLVPTMPLKKDRDGRTVSSARIVISHFKVYLASSSDVQAVRKCLYRKPLSFYPRRFPLDDEPRDPQLNLLMDYTFQIPWRERSDLTELELISTDVRPTTVLEIEWVGQITGTKRRV